MSGTSPKERRTWHDISLKKCLAEAEHIASCKNLENPYNMKKEKK
jgi:hypothetical protein